MKQRILAGEAHPPPPPPPPLAYKKDSRRMPVSLVLLLVQGISLLIFFSIPAISYLGLFRIILGIFSLMFFPGYCLLLLVSLSYNRAEQIGFSLIFGLTYQLLITYLMFFLSTAIGQFNFQLIIASFSYVPFVLLFLARRRKHRKLWKHRHSGFNRHVVIFCLLIIIGLFVRLYYQDFSINPHTDTALFSEMARNLLVNGEFTSTIIHNTMPMYFQLGFNPHFFTYFAYSLFFMIGGVTYSAVKIATIIFGFLLFFPIYALIKRMFDEKVALFAVAVVAIHPILMFFSSIPINGSEIMATLYLFSAIYFIYVSITNSSEKMAAIAGLFAFSTFAVRPDYCYVLIMILPILFVTASKKRFKIADIIKICLFAYPIIILTRFFQFSLVLLPITVFYTAFFVWWMIARKKKFATSSVVSIALFCTIIFGLYAFYAVRFYSYPQLLEYSTADLLANPTQKGIFGLGTSDFNIFLDRFDTIWRITSSKLAAPILFLSLISVAYFRKLREVVYLLSFPVAYSIVFALLDAPIGGIDHHRFHLASYFFLAILAAFAATRIVISFSKSLKWSPSITKAGIKLEIKKLRNYKINSVLIGIMIICFLFYFFYPLYSREIEVVKATDIKLEYNYEPAINWLLENTAPDSVIMTRKPFEFAWFTNRTSKLPYPPELTMKELRESIKTFKVNYLIVDEIFLYTYTDKEILRLYRDKWSQYDFIPVFESASDPPILIYNVTALGIGAPNKEKGPEIQIKSDSTIANKTTTIEYFDPRNATCYVELSGYSSYTIRKVPTSLFFEAIEPTPLITHVGNEEISFEGEPEVSYKIVFKSNLLLEIGWKDETFLEGWDLSSRRITFESDGVLLKMGYANAAPNIVWATALQKIDDPINVTHFSDLIIRYRFTDWKASDINQVYFTVRLYDESGFLEETPLLHPANIGQWTTEQRTAKSQNISKIELVVRTGEKASLSVEIDYIAIAHAAIT